MDTLTIQLPVKAIILYANYMSENLSWSNRKVPDYLKSIIGDNSSPDTLVNVTVTAQQLIDFVDRIINERYGAISSVARSIFNNSPAITGYTALFNQIIAKANGASSEKDAASYVVSVYNNNNRLMADLYNEMYQNGLSFINS